MPNRELKILDVEVLNECLVELPDGQSETSQMKTTRMLHHLWIAEAYSNMHASLKGMDVRKAWVA